MLGVSLSHPRQQSFQENTRSLKAAKVFPETHWGPNDFGMVATCKFRGPSLPCVAFGFASIFFLAIFFPTVLIWGNWRVVRTNHWPHNDVGFVWGVSILVSILKLWDVSLWFWLKVRVPFPDHRFSVLFAVNIYCISCPGPRSSIAASNLAFTPLQQGDSRWTCLRGWDFPATYE